MAETKPTCAGCRFFHSLEALTGGDEDGQCRAHPAPWPRISTKDWCGEHVPNEFCHGVVVTEHGSTAPNGQLAIHVLLMGAFLPTGTRVRVEPVWDKR